MFYLSEVINASVRDSADTIVGKLVDFVIAQKAGAYSSLDYILIKEKKSKETIWVPFKYVENLGKGSITLATVLSKISKVQPKKDCLFLYNEILDQQIVDTGGVRIVRVNDLQLGLFQEKICVLGIDVSFKGILRRLNLDKLDFLNVFKVFLIDWRKAQPIHGHLKVDALAEGLVKLHPADLANIVEKLNLNEGILLLKTLDENTAGRVMEEIQPEIQKILVQRLGTEESAQVVQKMSVDELVDLIQSLSSEEAAAILKKLPEDIKTQRVKKMLVYSEDTAGGLMSTEYLTAFNNSTVEEVIENIKKHFSEFNTLHFIYIIDKDGKFLGVVSLRHLLIAEKKQTMQEIMKNLVKLPVVRVDQDIKEVSSIITKYNLMSIAVVDKDEKMLGVVTVDDLMRYFLPQA
ncbi:MAG TPA: CBS domain-containing protein [Candidatus Magasanikbacteria bacterium]|nr:CBS domain-containing protein [Candidatus Magasanikbacteria bacterium]